MRSKNRVWLCLLAPSLLLMMTPVARAQLQFSGPANYPVGSTPGTVAVGDFNGDGKQDLAVLDPGSASVSILLGNGDGTYRQAHNVSVGSTPAFLAVGDFNGDHKLDLVVAEGPANTVSILLGNGDGTFQRPVQYNTDISADYVAVADFNNDKKSDLLISAWPVGPLYQGSISVLLGDGHGAFLTPKVTPTLRDTTPLVAIGDFNGDGKLDVATGNGVFRPYTTQGNVIVLLGNGDGTFRSPILSALGFAPVYLTPGDFNRDGKVDLALVARYYSLGGLTGSQICTAEAVLALLGSGDGTFRVSFTTLLPHHTIPTPCPYPVPHNPYAPNVAIADLNNDSKRDLVLPVVVPNPSVLLPHQYTAIWTFLGNGDGTFQSPQKFALTTTPSWLAVGELNGDTLPDLVVSDYFTNDVGVLLNTTPATR